MVAGWRQVGGFIIKKAENFFVHEVFYSTASFICISTAPYLVIKVFYEYEKFGELY